MEGPIDGLSTSDVPGKRIIDKPELPSQGLYTDSEVYTEVVAGSKQLKRGTADKFKVNGEHLCIDKFEVFCDEGPRIGGEGKHPTPMSYMAMGIGF